MARATPTAARHPRTTLATFATAFVVYLVAGWRLAITHHAIVGDAMARVANGFTVLYSRDPHLAAVGFVWNPLPSFAALPLLTLSRVFPALRTEAFAGNIVSAAFMAGSVAVLWCLLREIGNSTGVRITLTVLFAVHPIVMMYGANGDSEATLVFFLALTCLGLMRWLDRRDLKSLVFIGFALGFGYLSRQEFLAAGGSTLLVIVVSTYFTTGGPRAFRRWTAITEATVAGLPFAFAVVSWALSAWVIVGTATSYLEVNAAQVRGAAAGIASNVGGTQMIDRATYYLGQLLVLEPLWGIVVLASVYLALRRRDARIAAPLATFGAVAGAQGALFASGSTFGWLRFAITIVPLTVICAALLLDRGPAVRRRSGTASRAGRIGFVIAVLASCAVSIPNAVNGMTKDRWGREEAAMVRLLPGYGWAPKGTAGYTPGDYDGYNAIAAYFDRQRLPEGSVLTDLQYTFPLILKSQRPRQFVIPSDYDFERSVADPATFRVRYLLVSNGSADLLRQSYPTTSGTTRPRIAIGPLVRTFRAGPQQLSLFRVARSVTGERAATGSR